MQTDIPDDNLGAYEKFVPPYTPRPECSPVEINEADLSYNIILFDTETNKMGKDADLCQIAAINQAGDQSFSEYILPNKNIGKHASKVNNLTIQTINGQRALFKESNPVQMLTCNDTLTLFVSFIKKSVQEVEKSTSKNVCSVLVGHNAKRFDVPVLLRNSNSSIITKFQSLSICFADTLTLFEYLVKNSILQDQNGGPCALNQSAVYMALFNQHFNAHDTLADVKPLCQMLQTHIF